MSQRVGRRPSAKLCSLHPSPTIQWPGGVILARVAHQLHHLLRRGALVQTHAGELDAHLLQVVVAVEDAGEDGAALEVDHLGVGAGQG